jgi:general secretion pathway protein D
MLRLVKEVDIDLFAHNKVRFFKVENANAQDVALELEEIFTSIGIEKTPEKGVGMRFIPVERIGGILAVSSVPTAFERVERWIELLDTYDDMASEQVFIYFVENGKAEEIGEVLKEVYASRGGGLSSRRRDTQSRTRKDTRGKSTTRSSRTNESSAMLEGEVDIVFDIPTNSIIVRAIPRDYEIIKRTMLTLDRIPRQVLIEVLIAEVKLDDSTAFGVEWSLLNEDATFGGYKGQDRMGIIGAGGLAGIDAPPSGFSYIFDSDRLDVFLSAQASLNKLNILSSPHILALDNKEARIEVGEEVPIVTSEYTPLTSDLGDSSSRSVEYRSTGVILTVTPRINERGLVAMDINQEVSKAVVNETSGIESPSITNRKATTSLVVQDGQTILIGGLIIDETSEVKSGVPFLSSIPLLGALFGTTKDTVGKLELILLITPHVVTNFEEVDLVTDEFKSKVDSIIRLINKGDDGYWDAYKTGKSAAP